MMNYAALRAEIENDPAGKGYAQFLPDAILVVALLNAKTETMVKPLRSSTAKAWAASGPYARIIDAANTAGHPARASCLVLRDAFASGDMIHIDLADMQAMFSTWVTAGLITQDEHDDLIQRATQPASRAEVLGLGHVDELDVRKVIWNDDGSRAL